MTMLYWDSGSSFERNQTVEEIGFRQRWSPHSQAPSCGGGGGGEFWLFGLTCDGVCYVATGPGFSLHCKTGGRGGEDYDRVPSCPISHGEKDWKWWLRDVCYPAYLFNSLLYNWSYNFVVHWTVVSKILWLKLWQTISWVIVLKTALD